jgi:hypothetical protein
LKPLGPQAAGQQRLLFVLGTCHFEANTSLQVRVAMASSLGFLTSTNGVGHTAAPTSAIVVSRQEELVYMINPGEKEGQVAQ